MRLSYLIQLLMEYQCELKESNQIDPEVVFYTSGKQYEYVDFVSNIYSNKDTKLKYDCVEFSPVTNEMYSTITVELS